MPNIFDNAINSSTFSTSNIIDHVGILGDDVMYSLNTYKNTGYISGYSQPILDPADTKATKDGKTTSYSEKNTCNPIRRSLFNRVMGVGDFQNIWFRNNAPLLDGSDVRDEMRKYQDCSIKGLVEASGKDLLGRQIYHYSDFMYCKYLGRVPNNYLLTLRRFPVPCGDHINYSMPEKAKAKGSENNTEKHNSDVGRLVTWLGTPGNEMSNILSYDVKVPYKEMSSGIQSPDPGGDKGGGLGTFLNAMTNKSYQNQMVQGYGGSSTLGYVNDLVSKTPFIGSLYKNSTNVPYEGNLGKHDDSKPDGPVDVIKDTHIREVGLQFGHPIKLTFDYELRSYDGINTKAAFLDLISNILAVTYQRGSFWGGAYRATGASQSNVFANLPIYKLNGNSTFAEAKDAALDSGKQIMGSLTGGKSFSTDPMGALNGLFNTFKNAAFSAFLGASLNALGRPQKNALNSLLKPDPVGYWHLTIGNPWHPIMMIGNLIIDSCKIEQYGPLGLDDFPTGVKVEIGLKHGKGRDITQIEQMYMMGESRIYTPFDKDIEEVYKNSDKSVQEQREAKADMTNSIKKEYAVASNQDNPLNAIFNMKENGASYLQNLINLNQMKDLGASVKAKAGDALKSMNSAGNAIENSEVWQKVKKDIKQIWMQNFGTTDVKQIVQISKMAGFGEKTSDKDKKSTK